MKSDGLPKDMACVAAIEKHDNYVLREESWESLQAAQRIAEKDPKVRQWLDANRKLWR